MKWDSSARTLTIALNDRNLILLGGKALPNSPSIPERLYLRYSDWRAELNIPLNLVPRLITYEWSMCFHTPIRLQDVTLNDREKWTFLCFVDRAFLYNFVNEVSLVHNLHVFLVYLSNSTCFGRLCVHHQRKQLGLCDTWYLLFRVDDCLVFQSSPYTHIPPPGDPS